MVEPLLKWAGGKRWLTTGNRLPIPQTFERYVEPFLGSGAVFFFLEPRRALISDINRDLMSFYEVVRDFPDLLIERMKVHQKNHSREYYYQIRSSIFENCVDRAAAFLYLNRTCWNGLYRVNKNGIFNVPIGSKTAVLMDRDDYFGASQLLRRAELRSFDFEDVIDECGRGDFLFLDPPYTVNHNFNGFVKYNNNIFKWKDQIRLCKAAHGAAARGASVVVTNADHATIHELYRHRFSYRSVRRYSILSANAAARRLTAEAIFTANL